MKAKDFWLILKDTALGWYNDNAPRLGAALAYYAVFSLAPLLVLFVALVSQMFGRQAAEGQLQDQIQQAVGKQAGEAIQVMVANASQPGSGSAATILGVLMLIVGATGFFAELQSDMDIIWEVRPRPDRSYWDIIRDRLLSFTMVLGIALLLLMSLIITAALAAVGRFVGDSAWTGGQVANSVVSFILITLLFAMIFRFLPDVKISWKDVWLGAVVTSVLFVAGKFLLGLYLAHSTVSSAYGAAGSLAILLIWLYYSAQIFLFGAEFTKVQASRWGSGIVPADNAERVGSCS
jgi:membrane protein